MEGNSFTVYEPSIFKGFGSLRKSGFKCGIDIFLIPFSMHTNYFYIIENQGDSSKIALFLITHLLSNRDNTEMLYSEILNKASKSLLLSIDDILFSPKSLMLIDYVVYYNV